MNLLEKKLDKIEFKTEYLFVLLPFVFIIGNSFVASLFVLCIFFYMVKDRIFLEKGNLEFKSSLNWLLLLLWGIYIVFRTPHFSIGIYYYFGVIFAPFLLFVIIQNLVINHRYIYIFFMSLFVSGIILCIVSFYYLYINDFDVKLRIGSLWADMNILSAYYLVLFMFCLSFIINNVNPRFKTFYYIILAILLMSIFLTQTRGVWMALLFSLTIFFIKKPKVYLIASVFIGLLLLLFSDVIITRYLTVKNFGSDLSSLGRLQAWIASISLIKDNILIGYWFDAFMDLRDSIYSIYLVPVIHSHNTYLRSLLEIGLIGSILYFNFFFKALFFSIKLKKDSNSNLENAILDGLQLSFLSLLVVFFFEPYFSLFGCSTLMIWVFISLSYKMNSIIEYDSENRMKEFIF